MRRCNRHAKAAADNVTALRDGQSRIVLPTILVIVAIGGIAFVTQYLPSWRGTSKTANQNTATIFITFPHPTAIWSKSDLALFNRDDDKPPPLRPPYRLEMEKGQFGHYDFTFFNIGKEDAELGLQKKGCDCSEVKICVLPRETVEKHFQDELAQGNWIGPPDTGDAFPWRDLPVSKTEGVVIPAGKGGLIRLTWQARKEPGQDLRLGLKVWAQPKGRVLQRKLYDLNALVSVVHPVRFLPMELDIGNLDDRRPSAETSVLAWSPTRADFELSFPGIGPKSCLEIEAQLIPKEEYGKMASRLLNKASINTRILKAYKIRVVVHERRNGNQLDVGPIYNELPIRAVSGGEMLQIKAPLLKGHVLSDIRVGARRSTGINLGSFSSARGLSFTDYLVAPAAVKSLRYVSHKPPLLKVTPLKLVRGESGERKWMFTITVPPNLQNGPLPRSSALVLEAEYRDGTRRTVRIGITGTALAIEP